LFLAPIEAAMKAYSIEVHASPAGSPLGDGSLDYPTRTVESALTIAKARRTTPSQPITIWLHEGTYPQIRPLELAETDSCITIAAYRTGSHTDSVTLSGGKELTDWHVDSLHGTTVWVSDLPESAGRTLYVGGERIPRPRLPHSGYFRAVSQPGLDMQADLNAMLFQGSSEFVVSAADVAEITSPQGIEVVIPHFWIQERMPLTAIDATDATDATDAATDSSPDHMLLRSSYSSMLCLKDGDSDRMSRYYLDGVPQALGEYPGEWLADQEGSFATESKPDGYGHAVAFYVPRTHDSLESFTATIPVTGQLVSAHGTEKKAPEEPLHDVRFDTIRFAYADWHTAPSATPPFHMREDPWLDPSVSYASDPQAASSVPGVIEFTNAQNCALTNCSIAHIDGYGVAVRDGCRGIVVSSCEFDDLGAGAVSCGGAADANDPGFCSDNEISDCSIRRGGRTYPHCVAILLRHTAHTRVLYNEISDFYSSAIACGWRWDYGHNDSTDNLIEGNHLHHLGGGQLDWFGAIYTLGVSPGTCVRNNLIHDVTAASFGGWGILADPATSHVTFEGNVIHDVSSECFHIKNGRGNIVANNLFAHGGSGQFSQAIPESHSAATVVHNVFVGNNTPAYSGALGSADVTSFAIRSDANLIWDDAAGSEALTAADPSPSGDFISRDSQWRQRGNDVRSDVANPQVRINSDGSVDCDASSLLEHGIIPFFQGTQGPREHRHPEALFDSTTPITE
jgi:hypothetical protein